MAIRDELNVIQSEINGVVSALTYGYFSHMNKAGVSSMSVSGESSSISTSNIGNTTNSSNKMKIVAHGYQAAYGSKLEGDNTVCDPKNIPSISITNCTFCPSNTISTISKIITTISYSYKFIITITYKA